MKEYLNASVSNPGIDKDLSQTEQNIWWWPDWALKKNEGTIIIDCWYYPELLSHLDLPVSHDLCLAWWKLKFINFSHPIQSILWKLTIETVRGWQVRMVSECRPDSGAGRWSLIPSPNIINLTWRHLNNISTILNYCRCTAISSNNLGRG